MGVLYQEARKQSEERKARHAERMRRARAEQNDEVKARHAARMRIDIDGEGTTAAPCALLARALGTWPAAVSIILQSGQVCKIGSEGRLPRLQPRGVRQQTRSQGCTATSRSATGTSQPNM